MGTNGDLGERLRPVARRVAGPAVRRVRRELDWRRHGRALRLDRAPEAGFPHPVADHATPLFRRLAGVDQQLENPTATPFRLRLGLTDEELVGAWTAADPVLGSYRVYEESHSMTIGAPGVYLRRNVLRRTVFNEAGVEVGDELVAVNQARMMYQPFVEAG